ncbi:hydrogenase maturation protease [Candidatus Thiothrix sp. Deng01]|uniref:Hydrogenase maturation protease n=1 Tax=Candidatus Thiothrix phosphatis TaxID=3112415 RepID=A0ABU6CXP4_9GAMM|nr:hydrogenase maturation protease [Candidatus Thiothrix sp. Deng01]MEB4591336.1 hydrogenase maturation protease [Candidatus Thiothrix sp. Deng01]
MTEVAPLLLFGYGNPGRGDDALGILAAEAVAALQLPGVECLTDMQLQVEHITDLLGRRRILFVDADVSCAAPYALEDLNAQQDGSYTSHAQTPAALLHTFRQVYGRDAPPAQVLRIRGYHFALGEGLSAQAAQNLEAAIALAGQWLREADLPITLRQNNGASAPII